MASLRKAVSPDFTYSQSYLSLLSASGCMTGIICCASPTIWAIFQRVLDSLRQQKNLNCVKDVEADASEPPEPPVRHPRAARTGLGEMRACKEFNDEKESDAGMESEVQSLQGTDAVGKEIRPKNRHVCHGAIALFDFDSGLQDGLPVVQGQVLRVYSKDQTGWVFAQDLKKRESGFVPEDVILTSTAVASWYIARGESHHTVC